MNSWSEATIKEINTRESAGIEPARFPQEMFELYSVPSFEFKEPEIILGAEIGSTKQIVEEGDVLICKINPRINRVWVVGNKTNYRKIASSEWIVVNTRGAIDPKYLMYEFSSPFFRQLLESEVSGVGGSLTRARPKLVENYPFPLAPLPEQKRIVAKLDVLFGHLDQLKECLEKIPALLKQFRQAVLTQAVTGKLTEEWRGKNRIQQFDLRNQCEIFHANAKEYDKFRVQLSELNLTLDLPATWIVVCPGMLCEKIVDGTHKTPSYKSEGVPFLSAKNIKDWKVDFEQCKYISEGEHSELIKRCTPKKGSLLLTKSGTIGRMAILDSEPYFSLFESVAVLTPVSKDISAKFLAYSIDVYLNDGGYDRHVKGTAVQHLHLNEIRMLPVLLPPSEEQKEIVRRVESLFAVADRIEASYKILQEKIDQLPQAILGKAFRGELVGGEMETALNKYDDQIGELSIAAEP